MAWVIAVDNPPVPRLTSVTVERDVVTFGRTPDNDLALPDGHVSRRHVTLTWTDAGAYIEDHRSTNGTYIRMGSNWQQVKGRLPLGLPAVLRVGLVVVVRVDNDRATQVPSSHVGAAGGRSESLCRPQAILAAGVVVSPSSSAGAQRSSAEHGRRVLEEVSGAVLVQSGITFGMSTRAGFLATFGSAENALNAGTSIFAVLRERIRRGDPPVSVRMGLHWGDTFFAEADARDAHGSEVDLALALESVQAESFTDLQNRFPDRDRILCSADAVEQLNLAGVQIRSLTTCGSAILKGVALPVVVYCISG